MPQIGLTVMRKVRHIDPQIASVIAVQEGNALKHSFDEAKRIGDASEYNHLFGLGQLKGWIVNDYPRDSEVTEAIIAATEGFGIADESAQIIAEYDTIAEAESALASAKVSVRRSISMTPPRHAKEAVPA